MPTKRAWVLLTLALVLYFLANQTQVGWLYIITAGLIGLLIVAFFYSWGMLKPIQAKRIFRHVSPPPPPFSAIQDRRAGHTRGGEQPDSLELAPPTFHEDDPIEVKLQFSQQGFRPAWLISGHESCPFAPASEQSQPFFISRLSKGQPVDLSYQTSCDRRGLHRFPKLPLHSKGPFGLFSAKHTLPVPSEILIYPQYYPLKRLRWLEQSGFYEKQVPRAGVSSEVLGTREYRPGDLLRQIHWRSTARTGKLVVKEFADSEQLTLTVVLDRQARARVEGGKFSPFETAIRIAASFGYYATQRQHIPFYLVAASQSAGQPGQKWDPLASPLSWWAVLNYLARVEADGQEPLADVLNRLPTLPFVVVLISHPDEAIAKALTRLSRRISHTLAIFITAEGSLPPTVSTLKTAGLAIKSASPYHWAETLAET